MQKVMTSSRDNCIYNNVIINQLDRAKCPDGYVMHFLQRYGFLVVDSYLKTKCLNNQNSNFIIVNFGLILHLTFFLAP